MTPSVSPRFAVWLLLVLILTFSVLSVGNKLQVTTMETAYAVAAKRMQNKANFYKENWLIQKRPKTMMVDKKEIQFNSEGWPLPMKDGVVDCDYWLLLLNEGKEVFGHSLDSIKRNNIKNDYICSYSYTEHNVIILKIIDKNLSINIDTSVR